MWSQRRISIFLLFLVVVGYLIISNQKTPDVPGMQDNGQLAPCSGLYSNCISSSNDDKSPLLSFNFSPLVARRNLLSAISSLEGANIVSDEGVYIHAEISSYIFNVLHDVEFLISNEIIHYRCTSRAGFYSLPLARIRMDEMSTTFVQVCNSSSNKWT